MQAERAGVHANAPPQPTQTCSSNLHKTNRRARTMADAVSSRICAVTLQPYRFLTWVEGGISYVRASVRSATTPTLRKAGDVHTHTLFTSQFSLLGWVVAPCTEAAVSKMRISPRVEAHWRRLCHIPSGGGSNQGQERRKPHHEGDGVSTLIDRARRVAKVSTPLDWGRVPRLTICLCACTSNVGHPVRFVRG
jgi:hypothetical protein